jgi:hypothetical protein
LLYDCLDSLHRNVAGAPLRILVVDNQSQDGSPEMVQREFPDCELLLPEQNLGFAAGNNLGLRRLGLLAGQSGSRAAVPEYVLLLNPDTIVHPGAIEALQDFLARHPRVALVGPRLLNPDGSLQPAAFRFPTLLMSLFEVFPPGEVLPGRLHHSWWHGRYPQEPAGSAPFPIDHPLGACMLVRSSVLRSLGGFDEGYFMYSEEIDWCYRIRQAGWAIWQVPAARVTHIGGAATSQFRRRMLLELHRSRLRFFQQHYRPYYLRLHRLITRAGMLRLALRTWRDYAAGCLPHTELRLRLLTYGEISRL